MSNVNYGVSCPRCQDVISYDRLMESTIVCDHCGWVSERNQEIAHSWTTRRVMTAFFALGFILTYGVIHFITWDQYALKIIPLKFAERSHVATRDDLMEIARICTERMIYDCTASAYTAVLQQDPEDLATLKKLGKLQLQTQQYGKSLETFQSYFAHDGHDAEAAYLFAKLNDYFGKYEEADHYFLVALAAKPNILQVTVSRDYVQFLLNSAQFKKAKRQIEALRRKGAPSTFLSKEYNLASTKLRRRS